MTITDNSEAKRIPVYERLTTEPEVLDELPPRHHKTSQGQVIFQDRVLSLVNVMERNKGKWVLISRNAPSNIASVIRNRFRSSIPPIPSTWTVKFTTRRGSEDGTVDIYGSIVTEDK